jgi:hypothetical protein
VRYPGCQPTHVLVRYLGLQGTGAIVEKQTAKVCPHRPLFVWPVRSSAFQAGPSCRALRRLPTTGDTGELSQLTLWIHRVSYNVLLYPARTPAPRPRPYSGTRVLARGRRRRDPNSQLGVPTDGDWESWEFGQGGNFRIHDDEPLDKLERAAGAWKRLGVGPGGTYAGGVQWVATRGLSLSWFVRR